MMADCGQSSEIETESKMGLNIPMDHLGEENEDTSKLAGGLGISILLLQNKSISWDIIERMKNSTYF